MPSLTLAIPTSAWAKAHPTDSLVRRDRPGVLPYPAQRPIILAGLRFACVSPDDLGPDADGKNAVTKRPWHTSTSMTRYWPREMGVGVRGAEGVTPNVPHSLSLILPGGFRLFRKNDLTFADQKRKIMLCDSSIGIWAGLVSFFARGGLSDSSLLTCPNVR
jgi:hypothetical protein